MSRKIDLLRILLLVGLVLNLLMALAPASDFDHDGLLDSLVTEGFVLLPMLGCVAGLFCLLTKLPATCLAAPQLFSALLFSPPIDN
jgi:hypothetical protein